MTALSSTTPTTRPAAGSGFYAGLVRGGDHGAITWSVGASIAEVRALLAACPDAAPMLDAHGPHTDPERFLAPFAADPGRGGPYLMLGRIGGTTRAIVLARAAHRSPRLRLGYARLGIPALRCLDVVHGGLVTDGTDVAVDHLLDRLRALLDRRDFDHLMVNRLPQAHRLFRPLLALPRSVEHGPRRHWLVDLEANDFDATMARHSSRHRSNLRRLDRRLEHSMDGDLRLVEHDDASTLDAMLADVRAVAGHTYQSRLGVGIEHNRGLEARLRLEATNGRLRCFVLHGAGAPIAYQLGFEHDGTYHCEGTGYVADEARHRPGTVLFIRVLQRLCERGLRRIDFGFGDAEYKRLYGTRSHLESTIHVYAPGVRNALACAIDRTVQRLDRLTSVQALRQRVRRRWRRRVLLLPSSPPHAA